MHNCIATSRPCPVCDCRNGQVLHAQKFVLPEDYTLTTGYSVVACEACGAAFADTAVPQQRYDEFYSQKSRYAAGPAVHASDSDGTFARFRDLAAAIAQRVPDRAARIVDVGCANGQMLAALATIGYLRLFGIDPSPACAAQAAAIPGVSAFAGSLRQMPKDAEPYDVVIQAIVRTVRPLGLRNPVLRLTSGALESPAS